MNKIYIGIILFICFGILIQLGSSSTIFSTNNIEAIAVTPLVTDKFIVAWGDDLQARSFSIYNTNSELLVGPIVFDEDAGSVGHTSIGVAAFNETAFVIGWFNIHNDFYNVSFRIYDNSGTPLTDKIEVAAAGGAVCSVSVSAFNETAFVIGWTSDIGTASFRIYDSAGTPATEIIANGNILKEAVSVSTLNETFFVIEWSDNAGICFRVYDSAGTAVTDVIVIDTDWSNSLGVAGLDNNTFVNTYTYSGGDKVMCSIYESTGIPLVENIIVTFVEEGIPDSYTSSISALNSTHFVVSWANQTTGPLLNVSFKIYKNDGNPTTDIINVGTTNIFTPSSIDICSYESGTGIKIENDNFVISWVESDNDGYFEIYQSDGTIFEPVLNYIFIPPVPINGTVIEGSTMYFSWSNGTGNVTDAYNISLVGSLIWYNQTQNTLNLSTITTITIHVYAWNSSDVGSLNTTYLPIKGYLLRGTTPSIPKGAVLPVGIVMALVLFFVLKKRKT